MVNDGTIQMTADEFAEKLAMIAPPSSAVMQGWQVGEAEADAIRARWMCKRISKSDLDDPLLELCSSFDLRSLEIGMVRLCRPEEFGDEGLLVGYDEVDPIVYNRRTREVVVRDHGEPEFQMAKCARSSSGFLSALLVVAEFSSQRVLHPELRKNAPATLAILKRCLAVAGDECAPFYTTIIGGALCG